jgi:hypothetical protein
MSTKTTNASAERRPKDLGINLRHPPIPLGAYVEAVQVPVSRLRGAEITLDAGLL